MHSSRTLTTTPILLHAGFCATGLLLGLLSHPLFSSAKSVSSFSHPTDRRSVSTASPSNRPAISPPSAQSSATAPIRPSVDAAAVGRALQEILNSNRSETQKMAKLSIWAERATEAELKLALTVSPDVLPDPDGVDRVVLGRLAEIDGEMALEVLTSLQQASDRVVSSDAIHALFENWVVWDPQGAAKGALAQMQRDGDSFGTTMIHVIGEIGREFPLYARDLASQLARSSDAIMRDAGYEAQADMMRQFLDNGNDSTAAVTWVGLTQVSPEERTYLLDALVTHELDDDHVSGAARVFQHLDATANPELTMRLIKTLADTDPQTSRQMTLALPEGELRHDVTSALTRILLKSNPPTAVFDWLATQAPHPDFDASFERLADAFGENNPQAAWNCVSKLSDDAANKLRLTYDFGYKWLKADFARASQELPPDLVQKYQRTTALLQQLSALYSEADGQFTVAWRKD